jgi:hypothetical protein
MGEGRGDGGGAKSYDGKCAWSSINRLILSASPSPPSYFPANPRIFHLKVVTSEKIGGSGVISTLGTWCGGVVMGVLLPFNEAAILYGDIKCAVTKAKYNSICS